MSSSMEKNHRIRKLINLLKKAARENEAPIWRDVAKKLESSSANYSEINLSKINRHTSKGDKVLVPGKVLGAGRIEKSIIVGAIGFTKSAESKISNSDGDTFSIEEFIEKNPSGKNVKILE